RALALIPPADRSPLVRRAIHRGVEFLLSRDPAVADYPAGWNGKISPLWFRLGFPSAYVADLLQNLEALVAAGSARDSRLGHAIDFVLSRQDPKGRWRNDHPYERRTWAPFDPNHATSKWVTLRACTVLRAVPAELHRARQCDRGAPSRPEAPKAALRWPGDHAPRCATNGSRPTFPATPAPCSSSRPAWTPRSSRAGLAIMWVTLSTPLAVERGWGVRGEGVEQPGNLWIRGKGRHWTRREKALAR